MDLRRVNAAPLPPLHEPWLLHPLPPLHEHWLSTEEEGERRRLKAEAAERRAQEGKVRGLKDLKGAKRRMEAKERASRYPGTSQTQALQGEGGMRWQVS